MLNDGDEPSPFAAAILSHVVGQTVTLVVFLLAGLTLHLFRDHARQRRPPRRLAGAAAARATLAAVILRLFAN